MWSCRGVCSDEFGNPIDLRNAWGYAAIHGLYGAILRLSRVEDLGILPHIMEKQQKEHVMETGVYVGVDIAYLWLCKAYTELCNGLYKDQAAL